MGSKVTFIYVKSAKAKTCRKSVKILRRPSRGTKCIMEMYLDCRISYRQYRSVLYLAETWLQQIGSTTNQLNIMRYEKASPCHRPVQMTSSICLQFDCVEHVDPTLMASICRMFAQTRCDFSQLHAQKAVTYHSHYFIDIVIPFVSQPDFIVVVDYSSTTPAVT